MANWYLGSTKWTAITFWAASTAYIVGDIRRQLAALPLLGVSGHSVARRPGLRNGRTNVDVDKGKYDGRRDGRLDRGHGDNAYGWTAAHARLANTFAWMAGGDTCYVSNNHAETQSTAISLTSPGTAASPCTVLCVTDTATHAHRRCSDRDDQYDGCKLEHRFLDRCRYYVYGVTFSRWGCCQ